MLSSADFNPKGTISEVRVHAGPHLDIRDAGRSPNAVRDHAGTAQVDFEVDGAPPADSPTGALLINILKETGILYKDFRKMKKSQTCSFLSFLKVMKRLFPARLPVTMSSVQT